jgi:hypothetical protein
MSSAGSAQFIVLNHTALFAPAESPASTYKLASDTCNLTDDPSGAGNWATFSPALGTTASAFTVTATNGGTNANPAICNAVVTDAHGQSVTINITVTASSIGINGRKIHGGGRP